MSLNLLYRIFTSAILLIILCLGLFLNKYLWLCLLILASVISYYEFYKLIKKKFKKKKNKIFLSNIISIIYLINFTYAGYALYENSHINLIFVLLICIFSDTGGYIVGKSIGGKKLTKISPKKTISGSVGSLIFSIFPIIIFSLIYDNFFISEWLYFYILTCLFLSLICQFGDLFISYFKRQANVKDTGSFLPGHGGLLDRIDGIIFVLPTAYILDKIIL